MEEQELRWTAHTHRLQGVTLMSVFSLPTNLSGKRGPHTAQGQARTLRLRDQTVGDLPRTV